MRQVTSYIIEFLLGPANSTFSAAVSYGPSSSSAVVIQPSRFFEPDVYLTSDSMPTLPLAELEGIPVLYGQPCITEENGQTVIYADLIASTFFLLTRYEEYIDREHRDAHGRFPVEQSLPYRAGFLTRPIVEEYGTLLRRLLRQHGLPVQEPNAGFSRVYLTHDVDHVVTWCSFLAALRSTVKRVALNLPEKTIPFAAYRDVKKDPIFSFPWLLALDSGLASKLSEIPVEQIYFLLGASAGPLDTDYLETPQFETVFSLLRENGVTFGLHNSYQASQQAARTAEEKLRIETRTGTKITYNRSHVLASREPEDMQVLVDAGITDDFTMAYAGHIGFRLGTCRAVRWINAQTRELTSLTLHPMTVMDCTLDGSQYMALPDMESALSSVRALLGTIHRFHGEVCLLWHNSSVPSNDKTYQRRLYPLLLDTVAELQQDTAKAAPAL